MFWRTLDGFLEFLKSTNGGHLSLYRFSSVNSENLGYFGVNILITVFIVRHID